MLSTLVCTFCGNEIPDSNRRISIHVDELLSQSFEGWSEDAKNGYITACETLRHKDYNTVIPVTYDDFYISTKGVFRDCEEPTTEPNYTSVPKAIADSPSKYWYGTDEEGDYVIRRANHWCQYYGNSKGETVAHQNTKIVNCVWDFMFGRTGISKCDLKIGKQHFTGKAYLKNLRQRKG